MPGKRKRKKKGRETEPVLEGRRHSLSKSNFCTCYVVFTSGQDPVGEPCDHCVEVCILTAEIICSDAAAGR